MTIIGNPWRPYGLRADPYFQEPLTPEEDAPHPIGLFVGRADELRMLASQVLGSTSSRAVVQGPFGVGKTSVVNRLKVMLAEHGVLAHAMPVRVTGDMTVRSFGDEVLRVLTQIRASQSPTVIASASGVESEDETAFWQRVGRQLEGEDVVSGGISAAGFGASVARTRIPAERRDLAPYPDLARAIAFLTAARSPRRQPRNQRGSASPVVHERGRVLVHVNNLETLTRAGVAHAAALMQDLRDYFLIPQSHWVFVGAGDLEQAVFRASEAVSGIVPLVAELAPLTAGEVQELLERRYAQLRAGPRFVPPVAAAAVAALYQRYAGDLRNFLRVLSNAVQQTPIAGTPTSLTTAVIVHTMAERYRRTLRKAVGEVDAGHLAVVARDQTPGFLFRPADIATRTGLAKASINELLERLQTKGVVRYDHADGRNTYYRLGADTEIAFGLA